MLPITYAPQPGDSGDWSLKKINALLFALAGYPAAGSPGASINPASYQTQVVVATSDGSIPAGALSWSFQAVSGTVTLNGQSIASGTVVEAGGYGSAKLSLAIPYTVSGGSALIVYDIEAS